jgi:hypothetical protein
VRASVLSKSSEIVAQVGEKEWLGEEAFGPEALQLVWAENDSTTAHQATRQARGNLLEQTKGLGTVHVCHLNVEERCLNRWAMLLTDFDGFSSAGSQPDGESLGRKPAAQQFPYCRIIVHDENAGFR